VHEASHSTGCSDCVRCVNSYPDKIYVRLTMKNIINESLNAFFMNAGIVGCGRIELKEFVD